MRPGLQERGREDIITAGHRRGSKVQQSTVVITADHTRRDAGRSEAKQYVYSMASTCMTSSITQTLRQLGRGVSGVDYS
ncbi:hypothetical protein NQZ68_000535 [Dissostichus eleginoides]|nr:hypothetical protein NQZ68_000535 [Dissostichus eleginoides]